MRWLYLIIAVVALLVVVGGIKGFSVYQQIQGFKTQKPPKQTVSAIKVDYQDWNPEQTAVASLRAVRGADLSSEVNGIVEAIHFESGQDVAAGILVVQLRDADDRAHLNSLKAAAELARINYERDERQLKAQAISQATLDTDAANLKSADAQVAEQQALVEKKAIHAPFAGHLGIRAVDPGQYLAAGTKMVTLQQLDPIYVDFSLPQQALGQLAVGQKISATIDTFPDRHFEGTLTAIDPKVDTDTRNLALRATIANPDHKLLPGMYANVKIDVGTPVRYLTLPQTSVTFNPYGATVFVVAAKDADDKGAANNTADPAGADNKPDAAKPDAAKPEAAKPAAAKPDADKGADLVAKQIFITTGPTRGDQIAVLKGLSPGDMVVTSGQLKLKNGDGVVIDNTVQPTNDPNPKPQED